jgi:formamidopyrimidine-DNA glycosylase
MPELPEVETVVRQLREILNGETIARVRVTAPPSSTVVTASLAPKTFDQVLRGKRVLTVERRGKNILIRLSGNLTLWVHLKMTGHFSWLERTAPTDKHDLVVFDLKSSRNGGANHLRFNDYRRFGRLRVYRNDELFAQKGLAELGPEPLEISMEEFVVLCQRRPRMLKPALLDQSFLAGIGNIYADESLYASRLHPKRLTTSVSKPKLVELHGHIQRLLTKSIRLMGTTVDTYSGVNGRVGNFQKYLLVYDREGEPCGRCSATVVREKIGSRSAHFCPRCQRAPKG